MTLVLVAGAGCTPRPPAGDPIATRAPADPPRVQRELDATLDGKHVSMVDAFAWRDTDGTIRVSVSSKPSTCVDVTAIKRPISPEEVSFELDVGYSLAADGTITREVKESSFRNGVSLNTEPRSGAGSGDGEVGRPATFDVDLTLLSPSGQRLVLRGTIDAIGCPAPRRAPEPPPAMPATLTVAGKAWPIRSALVRLTAAETSLELSTAGQDCKEDPALPPDPAKLVLRWHASDPGRVSLTLIGTWIDQVWVKGMDASQLAITPPVNAIAPIRAGQYGLHAAVKVIDYPVELDGTITTVVCPP